MRQITLTVASKDYNITLDDDFADYFEADIKKLLDDKKITNLLTIALVIAFIILALNVFYPDKEKE